MTSEHLTLGIVQCALGGSREENVARVEGLVREAAGRGAQLVVTPELLEGPYFCREEKDTFFEWARPVEGNADPRAVPGPREGARRRPPLLVLRAGRATPTTTPSR